MINFWPEKSFNLVWSLRRGQGSGDCIFLVQPSQIYQPARIFFVGGCPPPPGGLDSSQAVTLRPRPYLGLLEGCPHPPGGLDSSSSALAVAPRPRLCLGILEFYPCASAFNSCLNVSNTTIWQNIWLTFLTKDFLVFTSIKNWVLTSAFWRKIFESLPFKYFN